GNGGDASRKNDGGDNTFRIWWRRKENGQRAFFYHALACLFFEAISLTPGILSLPVSRPAGPRSLLSCLLGFRVAALRSESDAGGVDDSRTLPGPRRGHHLPLCSHPAVGGLGGDVGCAGRGETARVVWTPTSGACDRANDCAVAGSGERGMEKRTCDGL